MRFRSLQHGGTHGVVCSDGGRRVHDVVQEGHLRLGGQNGVALQRDGFHLLQRRLLPRPLPSACPLLLLASIQRRRVCVCVGGGYGLSNAQWSFRFGGNSRFGRGISISVKTDDPVRRNGNSGRRWLIVRIVDDNGSRLLLCTTPFLLLLVTMLLLSLLLFVTTPFLLLPFGFVANGDNVFRPEDGKLLRRTNGETIQENGNCRRLLVRK